MTRYRGRHRKPTHAGRNLAAISASGAFAIPLTMGTAVAAEPARNPGGILDAIAQCESSGDARAQNSSSSASGLYQFIDSTWAAYGGSTSRAKDASVAEQKRVAQRALAAEGTRPWNASKHCWSGKADSVAPGAYSAPSAKTVPRAKAQRVTQPKATAGVSGKRGADGTGVYVCDAGHLSFDACDPSNLGQTVAYPKYDGRFGSGPVRGSQVAAHHSAPASTGASTIAAAAHNYLGVPYVWGGTTSRGMDCSGLVYTVLRGLGHNPPRTALAQSRWATPISASEARPGDLVFHYSPVSHVGIYIGGGKMIDASQPGTSISVHDVYPGVTRYGRVPS